MTITRNFNLYLNKGNGVAPYINVSQYDEEVWKFKLYTENGQRFIPVTGSIIGVKADGRLIDNQGTVDSVGQVVIDVNQQMTAAAGKAEFELLIENQTHGTANFIVDVEQRAGENAIPSESDLSLLQEAVNASQEILDIIGDTDLEEVVKDDIDAWLDEHPESTTTVQDGAITVPKLNDSVKNGTFENMTAGTAQAVLNDEGIEDKVPYKFRVTGGGKEVGNRALDTIVGGTVAWNQELGTGSSYFANNRSTAVWNGTNVVWTSTESGLFGGYIVQSKRATVAGHKYYATALVNISHDGQIKLGFNDTPAQTITPNTNVVIGKIIPSVANNEDFVLYRYGNTDTAGQTLTADNIMLFDLTAMFGSTIADYIYSLEQATAGAGVAWFKKLFPKDYYEYDAGSLKSVEGLTSHDTVGFNAWDEEWELGGISGSGNNYGNTDRIRSKNYIPVLPNTTYYCGSNNTTYGMWLWGYDADKTYVGRIPTNESAIVNNTITIPSNVHYIRFVMQQGYGLTYNNDICINLSDSAKNGTYEPYRKNNYALDSSITLRGIPKLVNGQIQFDGDTYESDGTVTRKYGIVDLGSLTWQYQSTWQSWYTDYISDIKGTSTGTEIPKFISEKYLAMATNYGLTSDDKIGITSTVRASNGCRILVKNGSTATTPSGYLVYELATPITEQADPYQHVQIIDPNGTEEYVSTSIVPVGHITEYPTDIVAKVNALPKDFSTLIAPTEKTFTATRNYTVNDLLIINNVLYKVTINIANGATITPNSNVQQTTLSALIKALS